MVIVPLFVTLALTAVVPRTFLPVIAHQYGIQHGCQTKLVESAKGIVGLAVLRSERDGLTSEAVRSTFMVIVPHVRSAVQTQIALEHAGAQLIGGALEAIGAAVFVCDADARVAAMSGAAEALLKDGRLRLIDRRLDILSPRAAHAMRSALLRILSATPYPMQTIVVTQPGAMPLLLDICPAPRAAWNFNFRPRVLVIARTGANWHGASASILQRLYRLSAAEADVALRLAAGESRDSIAASRHASLGTVRAQLKSAFAKLGVSREVELVAMLGSLLHR
jgi:DNA-binding CsgD family transcriptional regulator/PAS domain-containing protein